MGVRQSNTRQPLCVEQGSAQLPPRHNPDAQSRSAAQERKEPPGGSPHAKALKVSVVVVTDASRQTSGPEQSEGRLQVAVTLSTSALGMQLRAPDPGAQQTSPLPRPLHDSLLQHGAPQRPIASPAGSRSSADQR